MQFEIATLRKMVEEHLYDRGTPKRVNSRLIEMSSNTDSYNEHTLSQSTGLPYP